MKEAVHTYIIYIIYRHLAHTTALSDPRPASLSTLPAHVAAARSSNQRSSAACAGSGSDAGTDAGCRHAAATPMNAPFRWQGKRGTKPNPGLTRDDDTRRGAGNSIDGACLTHCVGRNRKLGKVIVPSALPKGLGLRTQSAGVR
eukprot:scaffold10715_cov114-Isochrysis_galbana.AAC.8